MLEEIMPGLHRVVVPIPRNPLKELNCYVIKGEKRNLVIDTGMNRPECESVLWAGLDELDINPAETDLFITHMHADHSGLISAVAAKESRVYCGAADAEIINYDDSHWEFLRIFVEMGGFPAGEFENAIQKHPGYKYRCRDHIDFTVVEDGDIIDTGNFRLTCVHTPGHTRGHFCLYEADKKILFSGDHILGDITPNISLHSDDEDPLSDYLQSLDKVGRLAVDLVLPGHRSFITDIKARIAGLQKHHRTRADEVLEILSKGRQNAYQVAAQMTWDMTYDSFEQFPIAQKWFAAGEALAHLKFLEGEGKVKRERVENIMVYSLTNA